ncbi:hypothetical protein AAVH_19663 [Aphelenchoides avenae]|nr:hypothetical protein AAVH_19663 [Aphelenchus avenae]
MVFTGLVQEVGHAHFDSTTNELHVWANPAYWQGCLLGASVAVNGCCLTIVELDAASGHAEFFVMEETRRLTNIRRLAAECANTPAVFDKAVNGDFSGTQPVNLEKSLTFGSPLGGHLVQGHVDGTAQITEINDHADGSRSVWLEFSQFASESGKLSGGGAKHKGSIALDGVSLTVAELRNGQHVRVSLIPFTLKHTTLHHWKVGDVVNVEFDRMFIE